MSLYRQRLQVTIGLVFDCFWSRAYVIAFDIDLNISLGAKPIVFPVDKEFYFIDAKMLCKRVVVVSTDKLYSNNLKYKR